MMTRTITELKETVETLTSTRNKLLFQRYYSELSEEERSQYIKLNQQIGKVTSQVFEYLYNKPDEVLDAVYYFQLAKDFGSLKLSDLKTRFVTAKQSSENTLAIDPQALPETMYRLGLCYFRGIGQYSANAKISFQLFRAAAELGHVRAKAFVANAYNMGYGVEKNWQEGVRWLRSAALEGHVSSRYNLGLLYYDGEAVEKDFKEAAKWFRLAAEQGDPDAQYMLGHVYYYGQGVERDFKEGVKWLRLAVEQGDPDAKFGLGLAYLLGNAVIKDPRAAVRLFRLAAENKFEKANKKLEEGKDIYSQYHRAMLANDPNALLNLFLEIDTSVGEELLFDIQRSVDDNDLFTKVSNFISTLKEHHLNTDSYVDALKLVAIDRLIKNHQDKLICNPIYIDEELNGLCHTMNGIHYTQIAAEKLAALLTVFVDIWYQVMMAKESFHEIQASIPNHIKHILHILMVDPYYSLDGHYVRQSAVILTQNALGSRYDVLLRTALTLNDLMLLSQLLDRKMPFETINQILGKPIIIEKPEDNTRLDKYGIFTKKSKLEEPLPQSSSHHDWSPSHGG